jgi:hypothetical protein
MITTNGESEPFVGAIFVNTPRGRDAIITTGLVA